MQSDDLKAVNTLDKPHLLKPEEKEMEIPGPIFDFTAQPQSFNIVVVPFKDLK
jgi:alpha-L-arabinofuranosidase